MKQSHLLVVSLAWLLFLSGCNLSKTVPNGDYLYKGPRLIAIDSLDPVVLDNAEKKVLTKTNSRFLGIPYKLILFNLFSSSKGNGLLRRLGEPPVLLSQVDSLSHIAALQQYFFSNGYFKPIVHASPVKEEKTAMINYTIHAGKRFKIGEVVYPKDTMGVVHEIRETADSSLLHTGDYLKLDVLANERERINGVLKNKGYFLFNPELIVFQADTLTNYSANLRMYLKSSPNSNAFKIWKIGRIVIHGGEQVPGDTVKHISYLTPNKHSSSNALKSSGYKTELYRRALLLKEGEVYSKEKHFLTIQRLINLETFQFVKFTFTQHAGDTVNLLRTHLYVTPLKKYRLKFDVSAGAKGNNYLGSKLAYSLINNNVFGGAEKLQFQVQGGADVQFGGSRLGANSFNFGGNLSLALPKLFPGFHIDGGLNPTLPETKLTLSTNYIAIPKLFSVVLTGLSLDYKFRSYKVEHNLTPLEVGTFRLRSSSALFDSVLVLVPALQQTLRSQLMVGSSYRLWANKPSTPGSWLQGGAGVRAMSSGNLLGLFIAKNPGKEGGRELLGLPIAQFVKLEGELRGYIRANKNNTIAMRTLVGIGVAYGSSSSLPYTEQFFIGGSNSLRAFRTGTIGPGSYHSTEKVLSNIEYGDFKLEINGEWRHNISSTVKFATFLDAGNVWLRKKDPTKPGADLSHFLSELAVGSGLGLRLDFSLLILRLDLGVPLRKPWYEKGSRWVFNEFDLTSKTWRKQNLVLNIGVGYPF